MSFQQGLAWRICTGRQLKKICGHKKWKKLQQLKATTAEMTVKSKQGNNDEQVQINKQEIDIFES